MKHAVAFASTPRAQKKAFYSARLFSLFLVVIGTVISCYLFYRHLLLASNFLSKPDVCSAVFGKGCDSALKSSVSYQLGLPLAGWSIIYYVFQLAMLVAVRYIGSFEFVSKLILQAVSFAGCLISLILLGMMMLEPGLFCPLCVTLHALNLVLFISHAKWETGAGNDFFVQLKTEIKTLLVKPGKEATRNRVLLSCILLLCIMVYFALSLFAQKAASEGKNFNAEKLIANYEASAKKNIIIERDDPILGEASSPIEVAVFSDFQCQYCQYFSAVINSLHKKYADKIHFVFKHFPLSSACNYLVNKNEHPRACETATAAEAARVQGKFWQFHDALFKTDLNRSDKTVCTIADSLGLDHKKFEQYRTSEEAIKKIARTVEQAKNLGIDGTPAVFVNGRAVGDFRLLQMRVLIEHILSQQLAVK